MRNILIYGGSFDPIHNGHLNVAKQIQKKLQISEVIFVPCLSPRWKTTKSSSLDRLNMLKLALSKYEKFSFDLFELNSGAKENYSIDTIRYFKKKYPHDKLYFLIGYDQLDKLDKWYQIEELSSLVQIVAYNRPCYPISMENVNKYHVQIVHGPKYDVSSTAIRELQSIEVDNNVLSYILYNRLYYAFELQKYLTDKRYYHSINVALLALKIAKRNKINELKVFTAALLHDLGKNVKEEEGALILRQHFKEYLDLPSFTVHQFVGAYLAKTIFNINDEEILNAIKFHATGNANMSPIDKIIYASDKIEPSRGFDSSPLIKVMMENYDEGFKKVLAANKEYLIKNHGDINNRLSSKCFKEYLE